MTRCLGKSSVTGHWSWATCFLIAELLRETTDFCTKYFLCLRGHPLRMYEVDLFFWGGEGRHWILNHYINAEHISKYGFLRTHSNLVSVGLSFFEFADHLLKVLVFQEFPCCLSRTYINGIGTTEMQRIYEVESCFFGKINKADNSFAKLTKKKRRSEMIRLELKRKHYKGLRTLGKSYTHTLKHLSH